MKFSEVRAKYPQYDDLSDEQLATALHQKFYADLSFQDFSAKVGLRPPVDQSVMDPRDAQAQKPPKAEPTLTQKAWASMPGRFVQGGVDVIDAGAQMLSRLGGEKEAARVDAMVKERGQLYDQAKRATGFQGADLARPLGSAALQMTATRGLIPSAATLPGKIAVGAGQGAGFGAFQPVTEGDFGVEKAKQVGLGAGTGAAFAPIAAGAARLIKPNTSPAVDALKSEGVRLTPGQILGGAFKTAEEKAQSLPIIGSSISAAKERGVQDLNRAALNRALSPVGESLPKGVVGRDAVAHVAEKLSDKYDDVLTKIGAVTPDKQLLQDFNAIGRAVGNLPKDKLDQFARILMNEVGDRAANGVLSAEALKAAESNLGNIARGYIKSADYDQRMLGEALLSAQNALRETVARQAPKYAKELKAINQGWANFLRPQRASSSVAAEGGVFTPAQLHNAVKAMDPSRNKGSFAKGKALMQDLSEPAKQLMTDQVRNSGTADRAAQMGLLTALGTHPLKTLGTLPLTIPPMALYSRPGVALMEAALTSRPQIADPVAEIVRRGALPLSAPFYPSVYGLLGGGQ